MQFDILVHAFYCYVGGGGGLVITGIAMQNEKYELNQIKGSYKLK